MLSSGSSNLRRRQRIHLTHTVSVSPPVRIIMYNWLRFARTRHCRRCPNVSLALKSQWRISDLPAAAQLKYFEHPAQNILSHPPSFSITNWQFGHLFPSLLCINFNVSFSGSLICASTCSDACSAHVTSLCHGIKHCAQKRNAHAWHETCGYPCAAVSGRPIALQSGAIHVIGLMGLSFRQTSSIARLYASSAGGGKYRTTYSQLQTF